MGKRRILKKQGSGVDSGKRERALSKIAKRKIDRARLYIESTYNNTILTLADQDGGTVMWSSSGSLGFTGNRKSTPFAAAKVGEVIGEKASTIGVKEADVYIKGVGAGRESALRAFAGKGIQVLSIHDVTPVPHNGPRQPKPRRV
ncbi:30S ribosomal protein S11 [Candidatus Kaiserbacteria bacterium RIFCSPHIGHO2_01_FULL_48_10]|uniref:Small ribosomal subunit protein uS11 n=1 Tax=Candidatus Kaiserbacteria bacterium RIFCSPHIGHO2_01_FULL_48_10 TaxID=1798476 RepID=A0A1F6C294_9BACT|nr:MAG: 30S ribosomal protein S11 [Candidatus Kaiserbacteria bacterium RIFCSPHIGHO2_01_FULL_48_10]